MWRKAANRLGNWADEMEMNDICWQVFVSVCVGLLCSGIANGLDTMYVFFLSSAHHAACD